MDENSSDDWFTRRFNTLSRVYQTIGIFSILFISLVLLAIYRSKVKKNAVVIVFLVTSWFSAWVTLIPILFAEHDIPNRSDTTISNVSPDDGTDFNLCITNAVLTSYAWVVIPALTIAFAAEVLRLLLQLSRLRIKPFQVEVIAVNRDVHLEWSCPISGSILKSSEKSLESIESGGDGGGSGDFLTTPPSWFSTWVPNQTVVRIALLVIPFLTSTAAPILVLIEFASHQWNEAHMGFFICATTDPKIRTYVSIITVCHLIPSSILNAVSFSIYLRLRSDASAYTSIRPHLPLLTRLAALALLTAVGAMIHWFLRIASDPSSQTPSGPLEAIFMACFPLIGTALFVDKTVLDQFVSWFQPLRQWMP